MTGIKPRYTKLITITQHSIRRQLQKQSKRSETRHSGEADYLYRSVAENTEEGRSNIAETLRSLLTNWRVRKQAAIREEEDGLKSYSYDQLQ